MLKRHQVFQAVIMLVVGSLGAWVPQGAEAGGWPSGGTVSTGWTHNGIQINCALDYNSATITASPDGGSQGTAQLTINAPSTLCVGKYVNGQTGDPGSGIFNLYLQYTWPLAGCTDNDSNLGGGNTCPGTPPSDPQNKNHKGSSTPLSQVACNDSTGTRTYAAYCEQGMIVSGSLTWTGCTDGTTCQPPLFTGLDGYTCDPSHPSQCVVNLSGFPTVCKGNTCTVDTSACALIFPQGGTALQPTPDLAQSQVLVFYDNFPAGTQCTSSRENPQGLELRTCHNDSFDPNSPNPPCNTVTSADGTHYHAGSEPNGSTQVTLADGLWTGFPTINLKCDSTTGLDNGGVPSTLSSDSNFDVTWVTLTPGTTPTATVVADNVDPSDLSPLHASSYQYDSNGNIIGVSLNFDSCRSDGKGVSQLICKYKPWIGPVSNDKAQVYLRINGERTGAGSTIGGGGVFAGKSVAVWVNQISSCPSS